MVRSLHLLLFMITSLILPLAGQQASDRVRTIIDQLRVRHYDQALLEANSALSKDPRDFRVWTLKGMALSHKSGDNAAAIRSFERALALSPNYPVALKAEAKLLFQSNDERSIPVLEKIIKANPKDPVAHEMMAVLEARRNECAAALSHFSLAGTTIESYPDSMQWYGYCLMREKRFDAAINVFERLVHLVPDQPNPRYDLALVQSMAGRHRDAIRTLQPLLASRQSDPDVLSLASDEYETTGDTPDAVTSLKHAIALSPYNPDLYVRFAGLCLDNQSYEVGIDVINTGLTRMPNAAGLYIARGLLYGQLAQYTKAEEDLATANRLNPADSTASNALASTEIQSGALQNAQTVVEKKLAVQPDVASLQFLLAKILIARGAKPGTEEFRRAMDAAHSAIHLDPGLTAAHDLLASMYLDSGQNALAAQECRLVLKTNPDDQSALYHLVVALRKEKQIPEAQQLVKRLLALQRPDPAQAPGHRRYKIMERNQKNRNSEKRMSADQLSWSDN